MLVGRPMVVSYKVSALTAWVLRRSGWVTIDRFSLPNLLADDALVPEILQEEATGTQLAAAVRRYLDDERLRGETLERFAHLADALRCDASEQAATSVQSLLDD